MGQITFKDFETSIEILIYDLEVNNYKKKFLIQHSIHLLHKI